MSRKVSFVSKPVSKKDLVVVILDESLEMGPNIISIDKEYKGIISNSINSNDCSPKENLLSFFKITPEKSRAFFLKLKGLKIFAVSVWLVE